MHRASTATIAACAAAALLIAAAPFGYFWVRSIRYTDDIYLGSESRIYAVTGMTRCKSMGGGMWVEFRPPILPGNRTAWEVYPSSGEYCFLASPDAGVFERLGFLAGNGTVVFPCWLPLVLGVILSGLLEVLAVRICAAPARAQPR
jgi:hypothetical protein